MDYQQLKYFLAACDTLNMTAAASAQNVSEQALSKSIRKLESELGCALFVRGGKSLTLTERGAELQAEARGYVANHEAIMGRFARGQGSGPARRLAIAVSTGTLLQWFPAGFLSDYVLQRPDLDFSMRCFSEDSHGRPRASEGYDLVFTTTGILGDEWEDLFSARRSVLLLMSQTHPLASLDHLTLRDLAAYPLGTTTEENPSQTEMVRRLTEAGCKPKIQFGPSEIPFADAMAAAGRLVVTYGGSPTHSIPGCVLRQVEDLDAGWSIHVLARAGVPLSQEAAELLAYAKACLVV